MNLPSVNWLVAALRLPHQVAYGSPRTPEDHIFRIYILSESLRGKQTCNVTFSRWNQETCTEKFVSLLNTCIVVYLVCCWILLLEDYCDSTPPGTLCIACVYKDTAIWRICKQISLVESDPRTGLRCSCTLAHFWYFFLL